MVDHLNGKQNMKNVVFILSFPPPHHGANADNLTIVENWNSKKYNPIIIDFSDHQKPLSDIGRFRINHILTALKGMKQEIQAFRKNDISIVFAVINQNNWGFIRDSIFFISTKIFSRARIVVRFPGGDFYSFYQKSFFMRPLIKIILSFIDIVITEGDCIKWQFEKVNKKIKTNSVYPGVLDRGSKKDRVNEQFNVLYICYHRKAKGFYDVLDSIPGIVKANPKIIFNFVGKSMLSDTENEQARSFLDKNALLNNVFFYGEIIGEEKWSFYKNSSILILPSYSEGLPTVILEGISFGLPIIATNVGVIPEIIKEGVNGFLLEPGDRKGLTEKIIFLSQNQEVLEKIGLSNRKYYLDNFSVNTFCKGIEASLDLVR